MGNNTFSLAKRRRILARDGGQCFYCGIKLHAEVQQWNGRAKQSELHNTYCHLDHVVAGGMGRDENLVACCRPCNSAKGNRPLETYRANIMRSNPHVIAAEALKVAIAQGATPYDGLLQEALIWHKTQIIPHRFAGELRLARLGELQ